MHLSFSSTLWGVASLLALAGCDWDKFDSRVNPPVEQGGGGTVTTSVGGAGGAGGGGTGGATGGGSPGDPCGTLSMVSDDFDDDVAAPFWTVFADGGSTTSEMGSLHLNVGSTSSSDAYYETLYYYDFVDNAVAVEVPLVGPTADASQDMRLTLDGSNAIWTRHRQGTLSFRKLVDGTETAIASVTFSAVNHRFWRLLHAGDYVHWQTSPDGATWVNQAVEPVTALFPLDTVRLRLLVDNNVSVAAEPVEFDTLVTEGAGSGAWCPIALLADDFDDEIRSRRWQRTSAAAASHARELDGKLYITLAKDTANAVYEYTSAQPYDMTGAFGAVRLIQPAAAPSTAHLKLEHELGWLRFELNDDGMAPAQLRARYRANDTDTDLQSADYDASLHQYWRIRDDGDRLVWELSSDGRSYQVFASVQPKPFPLDAITVRIGGTTPAANPDPGELIFDDFNVTP